MADREKLIELCEDLDTLPCCYTYEGQADYLIANGVTIQPLTDCKQPVTDSNVGSKWIPVTERLPAIRGDGFADAFLVTDGHFGHLAYFVDGEWFFTENGEMKEPMFYDVTHWMPLPEPPKGE